MISNSFMRVFVVNLFIVSFKCSEFVDYKNAKMFQIKLENGKTFADLDFPTGSLAYSEIARNNFGDNIQEVLVRADQLKQFERALRKSGLKFNVTVDDFNRILQSENPNYRQYSDFSWKAYYDIDEIHNYLKGKTHLHSESVSLLNVGKSIENRDMLGLKISKGNQENKPIVIIESGIHAREWIAPASVTYLIEELLTSSDPEIEDLSQKYEWHIFPSVNPDGYHHSFKKDRMWRKNRSRNPGGCYGVDLNRNWDFKWNTVGVSSDPCNYQLYCGSSAFSEPENKNLSDYVASLENVYSYVAFHSHAAIFLLPYSDSKEHQENYDDMVEFGLNSFKRGFHVNKVNYKAIGTAPELLYAVSGGSMDYVKNSISVPIVGTYELRGGRYGFIWPANKILEQGKEVVQMMIGLLQAAEEKGYVEKFMKKE